MLSLPVPFQLVSINVGGTFNVCRLAAARMATNPTEGGAERGVIINTASGVSQGQGRSWTWAELPAKQTNEVIWHRLAALPVPMKYAKN